LRAIDSCGNREEVGEFGNRLAVIKTISNHTKRQSFGFGYSLLFRDTVYHDPWEIGNLCNPSSVFFTINFDLHIFTSELNDTF